MDSLTQIVLGAAVGELVLGKKIGNRAMLYGAIAGTIPDLDIFCNFFLDDLSANEWHRGFSHSLLFCLIFAPLLAWGANKIEKRNNVDYKSWVSLFFWALFTHPLLDAHTTWGTQLLWPFDLRIAYKNIFVVDPLYTLPFLTLLLMARFRHRKDPLRAKLNRWGIIVSSFYMLWSIGVKAYVHKKFTDDLNKKGIEFVRMETKPTPFNTILWANTVETSDAYLLGYYGLLDIGSEVEYLTIKKNRALETPILGEDKLRRLKFLSQNWYTVEKTEKGFRFNDLRFGQAGMNTPEGEFVFAYDLYYNQKGELQVIQTEKDTKGLGTAFKTLMYRVIDRPLPVFP